MARETETATGRLQVERYHVKRTRVRDTSARHELGHPSDVGHVAYSKTFLSREAAQREADAWSASGEFTSYGPSDWSAEVLEGRAPR